MFCRNILGVPNKSSSLAALGELGRYPVILNCCVQLMMKYRHHVKTTYLKDSLVNMINYWEDNDNQKQYRWLSTVKFILEQCDFGLCVERL